MKKNIIKNTVCNFGFVALSYLYSASMRYYHYHYKGCCYIIIDNINSSIIIIIVTIVIYVAGIGIILNLNIINNSIIYYILPLLTYMTVM